MQQLEAQEARFAESLVSLQFQKAARMAKTLWTYTALLSIQDLLLEELSESETLTKAACAQILESHSPVSAGLGLRTGLCSPSLALSGAHLWFSTVQRAASCPVYAAGSGSW